MSRLVSTTAKSIRSHGLLRDGAALLVAVSAGLDSTVLLHVLHRLSIRHRWRLVVAHFNHRLRGASANDDEAFVQSLSAKLNLPCKQGRGDVRRFARENGVSVEMAARQLRHEFLSRTARTLNISVIATAHHADDQIELFLLRLLRGSGGSGLSGMPWITSSPADPGIVLIRPFLDQSKMVLSDYARRMKIAFREDASNRSNQIPRNRARNKLLPFLRKYEPSIDYNVLRTMEIIKGDDEFSRLAAKDWLAGRRRRGFGRLHPAVQRQVIQFQLTGMGIRPCFKLIEALRTPMRQFVTLGPGRQIYRDAAGILKEREQYSEDFITKQTRAELRDPSGKVEFHGLTLSWQILPNGSAVGGRLRSMACSEWFDADRVGEVVILRYWTPGDRFRPIGMPNPVKLQDLFTNMKIHRDKRRRSVIATTSTGEIFWVEGLRIGEGFKLDGNTRRRLRWRWAPYSEVAGGMRP